ncbi:Gfo/Idh/MocA family oxidoreductase [Litorivicinus sp.]|nr:Gfo/Idh/MocA family oxidoreductase [Litorivicinus sp.]
MTSKTKQITAVLIGAGKIGVGYDSVATYTGPSLSHLRALQQAVNVVHIDVIDPDENRLSEVKGLPKVRKCLSAPEKQLLIDADVIVIASPTSTHAGLLSLIWEIDKSDNPIICEKPTSSSETDLKVVGSLPLQFTNRVFVNYSRQWSTDHKQISEVIANKSLGSLNFVSCIYDKGLLNNGVHLIDFLKTLLGDQIDLTWIGNSIFDTGSENPTLSFNLMFGSIPVFIVGNDARNYSIFEIKFYFENGTLELKDSGRELLTENTKNHGVYKDYTVLERTSRKTTDLTCSMDKMYEEILRGKATSNFQKAIETERFCLQILQSHKDAQTQR